MAKQYVDYFNPEEKRYSYTFPDGLSKLEFRGLNEGDRAWVQNLRSMIEVDSVTKKMKMDAGNGTFKIEIISKALLDWDIQTKGSDGEFHRVPFEGKNIDKFLINLDPVLVDEIYEVVQENNAWLSGTYDSKKNIDKKIKALNELKEKGEIERKKD